MTRTNDTAVERLLRPGERRYVAKRYGTTWAVYDRARGSFPSYRGGVVVPGPFASEGDASVAAEQLESSLV